MLCVKIRMKRNLGVVWSKDRASAKMGGGGQEGRKMKGCP